MKVGRSPNAKNNQSRAELRAAPLALGKTLEIIALISSRPKPEPAPEPEELPYASLTHALPSPQAPATVHLLRTKTTLVVCPRALLGQWREQLTAHAPALTCFEFAGFEDAPPAVDPRAHAADFRATLARYDVVLFPYEAFAGYTWAVAVLHRQARDAVEAEYYARRNRRGGAAPGVPDTEVSLLTATRFWRLVLDEAQQVECGRRFAAQMVRMIPAVHRWCVTGTPINTSLDDLYGQLKILQVDPYADYRWWTRHMLGPFYASDCPAARHRMFAFLRGLIWRQSKAVLQEADVPLPAQHTEVIRLVMTATERVLYKQLYQQGHAAMQRMDPTSPKASRFRGLTLAILDRLRSCCGTAARAPALWAPAGSAAVRSPSPGPRASQICSCTSSSRAPTPSALGADALPLRSRPRAGEGWRRPSVSPSRLWTFCSPSLSGPGTARRLPRTARRGSRGPGPARGPVRPPHRRGPNRTTGCCSRSTWRR